MVNSGFSKSNYCLDRSFDECLNHFDKNDPTLTHIMNLNKLSNMMKSQHNIVSHPYVDFYKAVQNIVIDSVSSQYVCFILI